MADDKILILVKALQEMVYETTHLSREEDDGSHWCSISKATLEQARAALDEVGARHPTRTIQGRRVTAQYDPKRGIVRTLGDP